MILDGKIVAKNIIEDLKKKDLFSLKKRFPCFAIIQIGSDLASEVYIKNKKKIGEELKYKILHYKFENNESLTYIKNFIAKLNCDDSIDGIILQLPVPNNYKILTNEINPSKDVDGLTVFSQGCLSLGVEWLQPCTPRAVIKLLDFYNIKKNVNVTIIGRSTLVGKSLGLILLGYDATVQICHSKTENLKSLCEKSEIIILAAGAANFFSFNLPNSCIIDVGITKLENSLKGDFDSNSSTVKSYTSVPGGIGPITVACLMENVALAYLKN